METHTHIHTQEKREIIRERNRISRSRKGDKKRVRKTGLIELKYIMYRYEYAITKPIIRYN